VPAPMVQHAPHIPMPTTRLSLAVLLALLALVVLGPASALARGGGGGDRPEVRASGTCGRGAGSNIKIKARDGGLEVEFEVHSRRGQRWRVVLVHERRLAARGHARTRGRSGSFSFERRVRNYGGPDFVLGRAYGPRGLTCVASAVLPG
jgi:hypothetical protein